MGDAVWKANTVDEERLNRAECFTSSKLRGEQMAIRRNRMAAVLVAVLPP